MDELSIGGYPKWKYHPEHLATLVSDLAEEKSLDGTWYNSPADYGVETAPGRKPDKEIAKKKKLLSEKK